MDAPTSTALDAQNSVNAQVYSKGEVVQWYASREPRIFPAEETILARIAAEIGGGSILDIGVGAGRTTPYLLKLSRDYTGLDYSAEMITACQRKYPEVRFQQGDARQLEPLGREKFDFVFFSFNGLDSINHKDRPRVLDQVDHILKSNGLFLFSSHNLHVRPRKPWNPAEFSWRLRPKAILRNLYDGLRATLNYARHCRSQIEGEGYAVLIDNAHQFRLLNYYVTPVEQVRQLEAHGFTAVECFDRDGKLHAPESRELADAIHVHYLARKPLPPAPVASA